MCRSRKLYIIVEGGHGGHSSYWEHHRTNYRPFCSQNQIKYLQEFYRILVEVRVLIDTNKMTEVAFKKSVPLPDLFASSTVEPIP